jgi:alpha-tubulin suppressor-like RCC1 family protein
VVAISAGNQYSLAMTRDGAVYAWGRNNFGQARVPRGIGAAAAIAAGNTHSVIGLRNAGIVSFGSANLGELITRTPTRTSTR